MKVKIWGCRGSIPAPGPRTIIFGGNTACIEVRLNSGAVVIFDAGSGIRELGKQLLLDKSVREVYLVLTHSHWDHLMGFPFFKPAYTEGFKINVRGGPIAKETVRKYLEHQMEAPYFPARFSSMKAEFDFTHGIPIVRKIGSAELIPIPLNHPNGGYGFKIVDKNSTFVFLTDNEIGYSHKEGKDYSDYLTFAKNADLMLHDAQYSAKEYAKTKSWGHSTYTEAAEFAAAANVKNYGIFHHDPDHSDEEVKKIEFESREIIGKINAGVRCFACREGQEITLP